MKFFAICAILLIGACTPEALDFSQVSTTGNNGNTNNGMTGNNGGADAGNNGGQTDTGNNGGSDMAGLDGAALYQTNCFVCHGPDGEGASVWAGSIQGYADITTPVKDGVGTMPAVALEDDEIDAIQVFLDSKTPASPTSQQKYAQECAGCHGKEGEGVAKRGFQLRYKDPGYSSSITRNGRFIYNFEYSTKGMPAFTNEEVSDILLDGIWEWLDSLPNATSDEGLYLQFCANCHGEEGGSAEIEQVIAGRADSTTHIRSGHNAGQYDARTRYMTAWTVDQISDAEIDQINAHVSGL